MTQDEILAMAKEAGAFGYVHDAGEEPFKWLFSKQELEAFAKLVAAKEREACAEICDDMKPSEATFDKRFFVACTLNAQAIRARGQE